MKKFLIALMAALMLCSCGTAEEEAASETTTTVSTTTTAPEEDYSLLRRWTMNELYADLKADGISFSFPIKLTELEEGGTLAECKFENEILTFPNGGMFMAKLNDEGTKIIYLEAERYIAPLDFDVMDMSLDMTINEIRDIGGIPNEVIGEPDKESGKHIYYGAGCQRLEIVFEDMIAVKFAFSQR